VATITEFPVEALSAAEKRMGVAEVAATLKGLVGLETTPVGRPVSVTWTVPMKPFNGLTESVIAELVEPCCRLKEFVEKLMEKSAWGGGGGGGGTPEEPPPQPMDASRKRPNNKSWAHRLGRAIQKPHVPCGFQAEGDLPSTESGKSRDARS
jgi:hypothetical protein